jgi:hypothetical protein
MEDILEKVRKIANSSRKNKAVNISKSPERTEYHSVGKARRGQQ